MTDAYNLVVDWQGQRMPSPKRKLFTPAVFEQVSGWVASGQTAAEISARIGCTPGTLRVRCSRAGISLRRRRCDPAPKSTRPQSTRPRRMSIRLPRWIISIIQTHAVRKGITAEMLAASLLGKIAEDNLVDAVLDEEAA